MALAKSSEVQNLVSCFKLLTILTTMMSAALAAGVSCLYPSISIYSTRLKSDVYGLLKSHPKHRTGSLLMKKNSIAIGTAQPSPATKSLPREISYPDSNTQSTLSPEAEALLLKFPSLSEVHDLLESGKSSSK